MKREEELAEEAEKAAAPIPERSWEARALSVRGYPSPEAKTSAARHEKDCPGYLSVLYWE